uniref:Glycine zipper domain-containing protein n=1 Tax=Attheya septentrionalis TaxID=420275 RepID=A0A7S2UC84_9STRA|mmetsp:Transcript_16494/g.30003  ORF Transcript_16494/g.30003 Transcript_16494/m.30003 type:complete len:236 (+) Transcript_16494:154-861(+)
MVKISQVLLPFAVLGAASAFAPTAHTRAFVRPSVGLCMSEEPVAPAAPAPAPAPPSPAPVAAIVPIKEETVEFTAGLIGGAAGFLVGGPVLGALGAAAANYASKSGQEVGEVITAVSKTSIEVFNYLSGIDAKYEILKKAQNSLEEALTKLKKTDSVDPATIEKVESALKGTKAKITELNDEYDLVGSGMTALGVVGDLVEKAVKKAGELNEEYKLTGKAQEAISSAVEKAKTKA